MTTRIPSSTPGDANPRIIERPDGYWWQPRAGGRERGPFMTLAEAKLDLESADDRDPAESPDEVHAIQRTLGVPEWVDPETGELADDERTRLEDH